MTAYDVVVIGGGAAGLLAAAEAARGDAHTLLIEKNRRPGVKILASGGTRCNVVPALGIREIGAAFGVRGERFLRHALHALGPLEIRERLRTRGVETREEPFDKVFPKSGKARDVLEALLADLTASRAELLCDHAVREIARTASGFRITTETKATAPSTFSIANFNASRVIVTSGGASYPKTGTTGDGYDWLTALGHTIRRPHPALVPLRLADDWARALAGVAVETAMCRAVSGKKVLRERQRPVLFTHRGLSGPGPMDVSGFLAPQGESTLEIDWVPAVTVDELTDRFDASQGGGRRTLLGALEPLLPRRVARRWLDRAAVPLDRRLADLRRHERLLLIELLKRDRPAVAGNEGFDRAEVTTGGVALNEVSPKTMESRVVPGLYVAGEILDVDGPIGGFNFQSAFSTGFVAGRAAGNRTG